jgi:hypothetical protein
MHGLRFVFRRLKYQCDPYVYCDLFHFHSTSLRVSFGDTIAYSFAIFGVQMSNQLHEEEEIHISSTYTT